MGSPSSSRSCCRGNAELADTGSIGVSMYDWNTLEPAVRLRLAELFSAR